MIFDLKMQWYYLLLSSFEYLLMSLYFSCLCSFSVHAIQMGEKVTYIFEHAINLLARKDDVSDNR